MCWLYLLRILSLGNGPSLLHVVLVCLPTTDSPLLVNRRPSTGPKVSQFTSEAEALGLESSWSHHFQCLQDHKAPLALRCQHNLFWESLYFSCRTLKWMGEPLLGKFLWQVCLSLHVSRGLVRRRQWHPTPVLLPGKSHGWRSLEGRSPGGSWGSDTNERLHFHFSLSCIGEGNGNPLQCSCLENPRDGRAWWAAVYGVAQSWTWLKWPSSSRGLVYSKC